MRVALALLLLALGAASAAGADDWRGWRGLEREGRSDSPQCPTRWSPEKGVRWKTPIPGRGHSSPIVVGDSVVVTTAYPTGRGAALKRAASWGVLGLTAALVALAAPYVLRWCGTVPGKGQLIAAAVFCLVLGVLAQFALIGQFRLGPGELDTERRMQVWLLSSGAAILCLLAGTFAFAARSWARLAIALAALALAAVVILARPLPEYFDLRTPGRYAAETYQASGVALLIGLVLLASGLVRRGGAPQARPPDGGGAAGRRAVRLALVGGAFTLGIAAFKLPQFVCVAGCVVAWLIAEVAGLARGRPLVPRWFAVVALLLAAGSFAERNCLRVTQEVVRAIVCLDRDTGAVRWVREGLPGQQPPLSHRNSPATPTPVADSSRVFAWFGSAGCLCTDLNGKVLWTRTDLPFECVHGAAASPVLADGLLIIVGAQPSAPYIRALDCATGATAWNTPLRPWPGSEGQHRTPTVASVGGTTALLVWGWDGAEKEDRLRAYDARSGKELWSCPAKCWNEAVASVVSDGDTLFLPSSEEVVALSVSRASRGEDAVLWRADMAKHGPHVSSPVLSKGMLFTVSNRGRATCLDAATGAALWREPVSKKGCLASLVAAGDRVYFCDVTGRTTVAACEARFRKIAENDLFEPIFASPAIAGGRLFLRTARHVCCIGE